MSQWLSCKAVGSLCGWDSVAGRREGPSCGCCSAPEGRLLRPPRSLLGEAWRVWYFLAANVPYSLCTCLQNPLIPLCTGPSTAGGGPWNSAVEMKVPYMIKLSCISPFLLLIFVFLLFFFLVFCLFRATPTACGDSQARGPVGPVAAGLHHSHSNVGSKPRLQLTPQPTATPDASPTEGGQGLTPHPHGY